MSIIFLFMCGMLALAVLFLFARSRRVPIAKMAGGYIVIWFAITAIYVWFRAGQDGNSFVDEGPVFIALFGVPALCALMMVHQSRAR